MKAIFGSDNLKLHLDEIALPCFILEDKDRVFSKDGIQKAMGYNGKSENWLYEFMLHINRFSLVDPNLLERLEKNDPFEVDSSQGLVTKHRISPEILLEACQIIIKAKNDGFLYLSEIKFARSAEIIIENTLNKDIWKLIDFASGFELHKQNHKDSLARLMKQNDIMYDWVKTFPDTFYECIFKLNNWNWTNLNQSNETASYFHDLIFSRLSEALKEELRQNKLKKNYKKANTPERYIEHPKLKEILEKITTLIDNSEGNESLFEQLLEKSYPAIDYKPFVPKNTIPVNENLPELSILNEKLKKAICLTPKTN